MKSGPKLALDDRSVFEVGLDAHESLNNLTLVVALRQAQQHVADGKDPQAYVVVKVTKGD